MPSFSGTIGFKSMLDDCELIDAGFQGYPFKWKTGDLEQQLDKMVMNLQWRMPYQDVVIIHLPPYKSDHRPLLLKLEFM